MHWVDIWAPFSGSKEQRGKLNTRDTHGTCLEHFSLAPLLKNAKNTPCPTTPKHESDIVMADKKISEILQDLLNVGLYFNSSICLLTSQC